MQGGRARAPRRVKPQGAKVGGSTRRKSRSCPRVLWGRALAAVLALRLTAGPAVPAPVSRPSPRAGKVGLGDGLGRVPAASSTTPAECARFGGGGCFGRRRASPEEALSGAAAPDSATPSRWQGRARRQPRRARAVARPWPLGRLIRSGPRPGRPPRPPSATPATGGAKSELRGPPRAGGGEPG